MVDDTEDEVFDYLKGYNHGTAPTAHEEARNALYQGFITEFEHRALYTGRAIISHSNELVWLYEDRPKRLLTKSRMLEIQTDQLLGLSNGTTTIR